MIFFFDLVTLLHQIILFTIVLINLEYFTFVLQTLNGLPLLIMITAFTSGHNYTHAYTAPFQINRKKLIFSTNYKNLSQSRNWIIVYKDIIYLLRSSSDSIRLEMKNRESIVLMNMHKAIDDAIWFLYQHFISAITSHSFDFLNIVIHAVARENWFVLWSSTFSMQLKFEQKKKNKIASK